MHHCVVLLLQGTLLTADELLALEGLPVLDSHRPKMKGFPNLLLAAWTLKLRVVSKLAMLSPEPVREIDAKIRR